MYGGGINEPKRRDTFKGRYSLFAKGEMNVKNKILTVLTIILFVLASFSVGIAKNVSAASETEIEDAIVKGLAWLDSQQQPDGSWQYWLGWPSPDVDVATTGLVVLKFVDRAKELGKDPFNPAEYEYADNVIKGFDYIFSQAISDANGVHFPFFLDVYDTGISMMAVAASNKPGRVITTGPLNGQTYIWALQKMMDWMAYAQNKAGVEIGGWGYTGPNPGWSDNSNSGYASIGIGFASAAPPDGFDLTIPPSVLTLLSTFIDNVQVDAGPYMGGSIYNPAWGMSPGWVNILKTGNLLYQLALVGDSPDSARVLAAISFIETYWNNFAAVADGGGWKGDYQAMFALMKGMQAFGIDEITVSGNPVDWFDEVSTYIVQHQDPAGFWVSTHGEPTNVPTINTAWALLTLERAVPEVVKQVFVDIKPASWPNPIEIKSKGVLPVAVLGTEDFDVTVIDPASIRLSREGVEGQVAPIRWSYEDVATPFEGPPGGGHALGADGYLDLALKFDTQEVVTTLELGDVVGQTIPLVVTGNLKPEFGGTPVKGQDYVRVQ